MAETTRTCARCNAEFRPPEHEYGHKRRYCSEACKRRARATRKRSSRKLSDRRLCECGCGAMVTGRYVRGHNSYARRKPPPERRLRPTLEARFQQFVGEPTENGCLPWLGPVWNGATTFSDSRIPTKTHTSGAQRVAFFITHGKWPPPLRPVKRTCGNNACVNPDHLQLAGKKIRPTGQAHFIALGERFGRLTVIERASDSKRGESRWLCACECGSQTTTTATALINGQSGCRNCPRYEDLSGQRFGRLVALDIARGEDGVLRWRCQCDCGNEAYVRPGSLTRGSNTRSCGCLRREQLATPHLPGERFGRLTIVGPSSTPTDWLCRCDCGTELVVTGRRLRQDRVKSCGCIDREIEQARVEKAAQRTIEVVAKRQQRARDRAFEREERLNLRRDEIRERAERRRLAQLSSRLEHREVTACLICENEIVYAGRGRPRKFCPDCAPGTYLQKSTRTLQPPSDRDLVAALTVRVQEVAAGMVDVDGAARVLGVTPRSVKRLAEEGHLEHEGKGSRMVFEIAWLEEHSARLAEERLLV